MSLPTRHKTACYRHVILLHARIPFLYCIFKVSKAHPGSKPVLPTWHNYWIFTSYRFRERMKLYQLHHFLFNTLRPRQNGRHFADDTFKCIFMNENVRISINISLKFVPTGLINNIQALVQIMAWRRPGDKPLSEPMMVNLLTHTCVTRPQWVNIFVLIYRIMKRSGWCMIIVWWPKGWMIIYIILNRWY